MSRRRSIAVATLVSVVLAACGGGSDEAVVTTVAVTTTPPTTAPADDGLFEAIDPTAPADDEPLVTEPAATDVPVTEPVPPITEPAPPSTDSAPPAGTDPAVSTTIASPPSGGDLPFTLEVDGLGVTSFGADAVGTISFVSSFLGEPTRDSGWVDPFTIGACGGTELRQVSWGALQLEFGDSSSITEGRQHFYAYFYGAEGSNGVVTPADLATAEGVTVGSSVGELLEAYPTAQLRDGDDFIAPNFFVNDNLTGRMSGLADVDVVELIIGGIPCEG
ncbi:MAG: hypothetical protein AB8G26_00150 [Ilumatobacter sp.]